MDKWTVDDVVHWVTERGLGDIAAQIRANEVDGETLVEFAELGSDDLQGALKELGVMKLRPRSTSTPSSPPC